MFLEDKKSGEPTAPPVDLGTLRVDRIRTVADEIESPTCGLDFDMGTLRSHSRRRGCGTVCCIAGYILEMFGVKENYIFEAARIIGLESSDKRIVDLFCPPGWTGKVFTRTEAARTLRRLAETGIVDWSE